MIGIPPGPSGGPSARTYASAGAVECALVLLSILAFGACASGGPQAPASEGAAGAAAEGPLNVLSGEELRQTGVANLWDALRRLRPQWLRARASGSLISPAAQEPVVFLHGVEYGPLRSLQQMNIDQVRRVEWVDGRTATTRFGTGHGGGVIMVDLDRS